MWLRLDLDGLDFQFRIKEYRPSTRKNWDDEWCCIDLTLTAWNWLDYHIDNNEIMLCCEVEELKSAIADLLEDKLTEETCVSFIEPDLSFMLHPRKDRREDPGAIYVAPGHELSEVDMDMEVTTWNGYLTANRIVTCFGRAELEVFLCYLKLICGELTKEDTSVNKYMDEGKIYAIRGYRP